MFASFDIWSLLAIVLLPFWIASATFVIGALSEWANTLHQKAVMPVWMGLGLPLILISGAVPVSLVVRQIQRSIDYDQCVGKYLNALDPMNGCPDWTVRAALEVKSERTGA